jgi:histidine triad (HIT) family protein
MADDCVFCRIVEELEPATFVRRWTDAIAIRPLNPVADGHLLVIPHLHVVDATDAPYVAAATMLRAASIAVPPCNIITSAGAEASQTVPHLHIHVVPRYKGDGLALPWTKPTVASVANSIHITGSSSAESRAAGFTAGLQVGYQEGRRHGR